ncbi:UDP-N-acetylmuramoyl-tripeptide--D-alanyl-D-alanine ligase [Capsulimonas corticalis]|uniref:UDP-N-acetylmuramoyl-tripeptide--D-alanyl-D-alanine ligase n=1 Tax=Capsulimonas corticalis TaxID=2219043 RepID=A0A402D314_9BACT|nr:UDP-N-acetylmuramoyl-tripeptide--D-alanyl-D-alanine ligase [Capsulimonas corticalis]BDI28488.1 UDP-N-acetylmuramoyl-tripeptide--D-alanyl-D-alanine ligase [Capsulimonas corticalis]
MQLTFAEVAGALTPRATLHEAEGTRTFSGVSTDTRTLQPGDLFVALVSEKADGHAHAARAEELGAAALIVSHPIENSRLPQIIVEDTEIAYGRIARLWRDRFAIPVIAVTGSVGKTTTKEMLFAALAPLGLVLKTPASQNNETGVPKALLQLTPEHRAAIVEMGMRGVGQIDYLCRIANPTAGLITVIADNHRELLGSREAIADAKGELADYVPEGGFLVLNHDDAFFGHLKAKTKARVVSYGLEDGADIQGRDPLFENGTWRVTVGVTPVTVPSPSRHDIGNALAAYAVAVTLGIAPDDVAAALRNYAPPPMRMEVVMLASRGVTVLNDSYNAAPASVRSALETLTSHGSGRKIAFLGDMKELGDVSRAAHIGLGEAIAELGGVDALYTVGELAADIAGAARRFADSAEAAAFAAKDFEWRAGDVALVKGSRAMAMEKIASAIQNLEQNLETKPMAETTVDHG